jgi:biopolymer transport protein ExbD
MVMQHSFRIILPSLLTAAMTGGLWAMEDANMAAPTAPVATPVSAAKPAPTPKAPLAPAEYKRTDTNFYPKGDFVKDHAGAVIIPRGGYTQKEDSYFFTPKIRAPKTIYVETLDDWIEPITPPDMPASLGVPADAMQIREPQGDVQVALPSAPANFSPATDNMTLPNGAVVKTGENGTAAVLFGGVDSARLMPNSAAAMQQTVTATSRVAEVDLTAGGVFSKVGTQVGVKGSYEVHTPFGNAVAQGGDFVTVITSSRADVWVAQGTVNFENPAASNAAEAVTSDGTGPLKILRSPAIADSHQTLLADVETLTPTLNFIPLANQKVKGLRDKQAQGTTLSANEEAYLGRIKQVPSLIKLDLVPPPAPVVVTPPPAEPPPPITDLSSLGFASGPVPMQLTVHSDGTVDTAGAPLALEDLKARVAAIAKANAQQPIVIVRDIGVTESQVRKVAAICSREKLPIKVLKPGQVLNLGTPLGAVVSPPVAAPAPPKVAATEKPLSVNIHADGSVGFRGVKMDLPAFQSKLADLGKATPDQAFVVHAGADVPEEKIEPVMDSFKAAGLDHATLAPRPVAATPPAPAPPAPAPSAEVPAPHLAVPPVTAPEKPASATAKPYNVAVHADGSVRFHGTTMDLPAFQAKLAEIAKTTPDQAFVVHPNSDVPREKLQAVLDSFHAANLPNVSVATRPVAATPPPPAIPPVAPVTPAEAPPAPADIPAPHLATPKVSAVRVLPVEIRLHSNGKMELEGTPVSLDDLKARLTSIAKATPSQTVVVRQDDQTAGADVKKVLAICQDLKLKTKTVKVKFVSMAPDKAPATAPTPTAPSPSPAENLPAPGLLMHPTMQAPSTDSNSPSPRAPASP